MRTEQQASKHYSDSKTALISGLLYTFICLTGIAALFHLVGLDWFASTVVLQEPAPVIQKAVRAFLKILELVFMYKISTRKSFLTCIIMSALHTGAVGFLPSGLIQSCADFILILALPTILRKDSVRGLLDSLGMYAVLMAYTSLFMLAKFGGIYPEYNYSFYANIVSLVDYKLFIITLYLYTKQKGGLHIWKIRLIN